MDAAEELCMWWAAGSPFWSELHRMQFLAMELAACKWEEFCDLGLRVILYSRAIQLFAV